MTQTEDYQHSIIVIVVDIPLELVQTCTS